MIVFVIELLIYADISAILHNNGNLMRITNI